MFQNLFRFVSLFDNLAYIWNMNETKMIQKSIYTFLENGSLNYGYGVSLLREVCNKKMLIQNLSRKESTANASKLNYELKKYLSDCNYKPETEDLPAPIKNAVPEVEKPKLVAPAVKKQYSAEEDDQISQAIESLMAKKRELYGQRDHLHPQLSIVQDDEERFEIAKKIHAIQPKLDALQNQINGIKNTGVLPVEVAAKEMTGDQFKRFQQVKSYIRRYKALVAASITVNDKKKYEALLKKYQTELNTIN